MSKQHHGGHHNPHGHVPAHAPGHAHGHTHGHAHAHAHGYAHGVEHRQAHRHGHAGRHAAGPKLRILVLHGSRQDGGVFAARLKTLTKKLSPIAVRGGLARRRRGPRARQRPLLLRRGRGATAGGAHRDSACGAAPDTCAYATASGRGR